MRQQYMHFSHLPPKSRFFYNGNEYLKRSTRTAEIINPPQYSGVWFYFNKRDHCVVGKYSGI